MRDCCAYFTVKKQAKQFTGTYNLLCIAVSGTNVITILNKEHKGGRHPPPPPPSWRVSLAWPATAYVYRLRCWGVVEQGFPHTTSLPPVGKKKRWNIFYMDVKTTP